MLAVSLVPRGDLGCGERGEDAIVEVRENAYSGFDLYCQKHFVLRLLRLQALLARRAPRAAAAPPPGS